MTIFSSRTVVTVAHTIIPLLFRETCGWK